jgi:copper chaperone
MSGTTQITSYAVAGMTCGHCVTAVTQEVGSLAGVTGVTGVTGVEVDLVAGGLSRLRVSTEGAVGEQVVSEAVEEARYHLAGVPD